MCTACLPEKKENKISNPADRQTDGQNGQLDEVLRLIECLRSATSCKILHSLAKQTYLYMYIWAKDALSAMRKCISFTWTAQTLRYLA